MSRREGEMEKGSLSKRRIFGKRLIVWRPWAAVFLAVSLIVGGCSLAPKYERPAAPVPGDWPTGAAYPEKVAPDAKKGADTAWEEYFTDPALKTLIAEALKNNRDLRLAVLNVERAMALYGVQRSELFPALNAVGAMSKGRVPADLSYTGKETTAEQYSVNLGVTAWEVDFFGRIRSLKDRAWEEYMATEMARRSARTLLVAAVASAYLNLAADREALELSRAVLEAQEETHRLIKRRYDVGFASALDVQRSLSQVEAARADVARYTQLTAQDENALQLLVGSPLPRETLPTSLSACRPLGELSPGLPSETLLKRPDVMMAEHRLKGANANVGAARAALFPRIALTATFGTASAELSGLFRDGSSTWNFAPQIVLPIFDARTWSAYKVTKVEREIMVAQYEKTIQTAFREVADALAVEGSVRGQLQAQESLVAALAEAHRLARVRYEKGMDGYLSVLDAQRSWYGARKGLISLRLLRSTNRVNLYKVLGGGA